MLVSRQRRAHKLPRQRPHSPHPYIRLNRQAAPSPTSSSSSSPKADLFVVPAAGGSRPNIVYLTDVAAPLVPTLLSQPQPPRKTRANLFRSRQPPSGRPLPADAPVPGVSPLVLPSSPGRSSSDKVAKRRRTKKALSLVLAGGRIVSSSFQLVRDARHKVRLAELEKPEDEGLALDHDRKDFVETLEPTRSDLLSGTIATWRHAIYVNSEDTFNVFSHPVDQTLAVSPASAHPTASSLLDERVTIDSWTPKLVPLSPYPPLLSALPSPESDTFPPATCSLSADSTSTFTRTFHVPGAFVTSTNDTSPPADCAPSHPTPVLATSSSADNELDRIPGSFPLDLLPVPAEPAFSADAGLAVTLVAGAFTSLDRQLRRHYALDRGGCLDNSPPPCVLDLNEVIEQSTVDIVRPAFHLAADVRASSLAYRRRHQPSLQGRRRDSELVLQRRQEMHYVRRRAVSLQRHEFGAYTRPLPTDPSPECARPSSMSRRFKSLSVTVKNSLTGRQRASPSEFARNFSPAPVKPSFVEAFAQLRRRPLSPVPAPLPEMVGESEPDMDLMPEPVVVLDPPHDEPGFSPAEFREARRQSIIKWNRAIFGPHSSVPNSDVQPAPIKSMEEKLAELNATVVDLDDLSPLQVSIQRIGQWRAQVLEAKAALDSPSHSSDDDPSASWDRSFPDIRQRRFEQQLRSAGQTVEDVRNAVGGIVHCWLWGVPDGEILQYESRASSLGGGVVEEEAGWLAPW